MKAAHKHGQFHGAGHVKKQRKKHRAAERMTRTSSPPLSEHFAVWNKGKIAAQKPRHRKQSLKHTVFLHFSNLDLAKDLSPDLLAELCGAASEISDKQATRIGEFLLCVLAFLILCGKPLKTACRYIPRPPFHSRFSRCTAPPPPRAPSRPDSLATRSSTRWKAPSRPGRSPGAAWRRRRS